MKFIYKLFQANKQIFMLLLVIVILLILGTIVTDSFMTARNFFTVGIRTSILGCLVIGQTFAILIGGIDLTVGALLAFISVMAGFSQNFSLAVILILCIGTGAFIGVLNGLAISKLRVPPIITTLAMMSIIQSVGLVWSDGYPVPVYSESFKFILTGKILFIPVPLFVWIALCIIAELILAYTRLGRHVYAVGGNEQAGRVAGVNITKIKLIAYGISGVMAAIGGVLYVARTNHGWGFGGEGMELNSIAAVIIGGISLTGGKGRIIGPFLGVIILALISNLMNLLNVSAFIDPIVKGGAILIVVAISKLRAGRILPSARIKAAVPLQKGCD